jgi:hypothetical protein
MTRRDWIKTVGGLFPVVTLIACGSNTAKPDASIDAAPGSCATPVIDDNHTHAPHAFTVSIDEVNAAITSNTPIMKSIQGAANHDHIVTYSVADCVALKAGGMAMETSTMTVCHTHVCHVTCSAA